jgi:hypothetical protein
MRNCLSRENQMNKELQNCYNQLAPLLKRKPINGKTLQEWFDGEPPYPIFIKPQETVKGVKDERKS